MDVLELTLLTCSNGITRDTPQVLSALQNVRQKLKENYGSSSHPTYSGSRFFVLSDINEEPASNSKEVKEIFILGVWTSMEAHHAFLGDLEKAREILSPQEGLTTFEWSAHLTSSWVLADNKYLLSCEDGRSEFVLRRYSGIPRAAKWFWAGLVKQCEEQYGEVAIKARSEDEAEAEMLTYFIFHAADLRGDNTGSEDEVNAFIEHIERGARMNGWESMVWRLRDMEAIRKEKEIVG